MPAREILRRDESQGAATTSTLRSSRPVPPRSLARVSAAGASSGRGAGRASQA